MIVAVFVAILVLIALQAAGIYVACCIFAYMRDPVSEWRWPDFRELKRRRRPKYD